MRTRMTRTREDEDDEGGPGASVRGGRRYHRDAAHNRLTQQCQYYYLVCIYVIQMMLSVPRASTHNVRVGESRLIAPRRALAFVRLPPCLGRPAPLVRRAASSMLPQPGPAPECLVTI
jgi:hypothetical protein